MLSTPICSDGVVSYELNFYLQFSISVIMETTDLGSVLGIASGVSASVLMICIAIGLTAKFRHQQSHPNHSTPHLPQSSNNIRREKIAMKSVGHHQNDSDMNPDILINSHSGNY